MKTLLEKTVGDLKTNDPQNPYLKALQNLLDDQRCFQENPHGIHPELWKKACECVQECLHECLEKSDFSDLEQKLNQFNILNEPELHTQTDVYGKKLQRCVSTHVFLQSIVWESEDSTLSEMNLDNEVYLAACIDFNDQTYPPDFKMDVELDAIIRQMEREGTLRPDAFSGVKGKACWWYFDLGEPSREANPESLGLSDADQISNDITGKYFLFEIEGEVFSERGEKIKFFRPTAIEGFIEETRFTPNRNDEKFGRTTPDKERPNGKTHAEVVSASFGMNQNRKSVSKAVLCDINPERSVSFLHIFED